MDYFADIADERRGFADLIDTLSPQQLATPSLCAGWTVHDVAAHLVVPLVTGMGAFMIEMAKARGNFNSANDALTRSVAAKPSSELSELLRAHADSHFTPPGANSLAPLSDAIIHGQDVRRPLGITRDIPQARLVAILDFLVSPTAARGFVGKGLLTGLRFDAPDIGWTHGQGPQIAGSGEAVMMALAGRKIALGDLSGDGVSVLAARL